MATETSTFTLMEKTKALLVSTFRQVNLSLPSYFIISFKLSKNCNLLEFSMILGVFAVIDLYGQCSQVTITSPRDTDLEESVETTHHCHSPAKLAPSPPLKHQ